MIGGVEEVSNGDRVFRAYGAVNEAVVIIRFRPVTDVVALLLPYVERDEVQNGSIGSGPLAVVDHYTSSLKVLGVGGGQLVDPV